MSASLRRLPLLVAAVLARGVRRVGAGEATTARRPREGALPRGTSYYDLGRYDDAIKEFEAAYQLKNDPAFLYNLAQSYRLAGNEERALHFYETYLRYVPKAPNRAEIEDRITALERQMATKSKATHDPAARRDDAPCHRHDAAACWHDAATRRDAADRHGDAAATEHAAAADLPASGRHDGAAAADQHDAAGSARPGTQVPHRRHRDGRRGRCADPRRPDPGRPRGRGGERRRRRGQDRHAVRSGGRAARPVGRKCAVVVPGPRPGRRRWRRGAVVLRQAGDAAAETTTWRVSLAPVVAPSINGATLRITF